MCRTVYDAAIMLEVISGRPGGYTRDLDKSKRLDGVRLLVPTNLTDWKSELLQAEQKVIFESACQTLKDLGADLVQTAVSGECVELDRDREIRLRVWEPQFVQEIEKYLASLK